MARCVASIWDTRPGTFRVNARSAKRIKELIDVGWSLKGAHRYVKAMDETIGRGLRKRLRQARN